MLHIYVLGVQTTVNGFRQIKVQNKRTGTTSCLMVLHFLPKRPILAAFLHIRQKMRHDVTLNLLNKTSQSINAVLTDGGVKKKKENRLQGLTASAVCTKIGRGSENLCQ